MEWYDKQIQELHDKNYENAKLIGKAEAIIEHFVRVSPRTIDTEVAENWLDDVEKKFNAMETE